MGGERKLQCVCVRCKEKEWGLRVNMHHCSRLIFHQTAGSVQHLPPPLDTTVCHTGGGVEVQEICSSRGEEEEEGGRGGGEV